MFVSKIGKNLCELSISAPSIINKHNKANYIVLVVSVLRQKMLAFKTNICGREVVIEM